MRRLYLDHAATSFPKAPGVLEAMVRYASELGASPGRGAYAEAREAGRLLQQCRERLCQLFRGENPAHVIFTLNTTDALNLAIKGIVQHQLQRGHKPHVITTWLDHNSVLRPLNALSHWPGVDATRVPCDPLTGWVDPQDIRKAIKPSTALIAVVHGSNVSGTLQPIAEIGAIARQHDIPFLVDAAQTLGHVPIDVQAQLIDLLAFPGHKGLLGPLGTGGLYIRPGIEKRMTTVREGGTGSASEVDVQPEFMPDRFEPGSHNALGIIGLSAAVQWILERSVDSLWQHEQQLTQAMLEGLQSLAPRLRFLGPQTAHGRCGVFSVRIEGYDKPQALSDVLEQEFGILTRSGIHCAPLAHQTLGTHAAGGATRLSLGPFIRIQDVHDACSALSQIVGSDQDPLTGSARASRAISA